MRHPIVQNDKKTTMNVDTLLYDQNRHTPERGREWEVQSMGAGKGKGGGGSRVTPVCHGSFKSDINALIEILKSQWSSICTM
jgi:hypothetical protein